MSTMVRYNNGRSIMDSLFTNMFEGIESGTVRRPAVDVIEHNDKYLLTADLPGVTEDQLELTLEDGRLKLETSVLEAETEEHVRYLLRERKTVQFTRSFGLPRDVDQSKISARFSNGVLTLELMKSEDAKPKSIKIN